MEKNIQTNLSSEIPIKQETVAKKKNPFVVVLLGIVAGILLIGVVILGIRQFGLRNKETGTAKQTQERTFSYKESTPSGSNNTGTADTSTKSEEITDLEGLNDELNQVLTDLENSFQDINSYKSQDDSMPSL